MQYSQDELYLHYESLSDEELLAIDPNELTDMAIRCYDREFNRRRLSREQIEPDQTTLNTEADREAPAWLDSAATACSFQILGGKTYAEDAEQACAILGDAGIPSHVVTEARSPFGLFNVMVPGSLSLKATSVLDRDLFNEELEEIWRTHFDQLSDDELDTLNADDLCAGLLDRAARLKRIYEEAASRRKSEPRAF